MLGGLDLLLVLFGDVAEGQHVGVAVEGVVVERHLGVEELEGAVAGDDQGVHLQQGHVLLDEGLVERRKQGAGLFGGLAGQVQGLGHRLGVVRPGAGGRVDREGVDLFGGGVRHFLDVHAPFGGGDHRHAAGLAVHQQGEVQFLGDRGAFLDVEAAHQAALGSGLVGDQGHAQHAGRFRANLVDGLAHLDPAALAAPAGVDLGLHHPDRSAQLLRRGHGLLDAERRIAARNGDAIVGEDGLGLVFVYVHGGSDRWGAVKSRSS